jgi:hypothetical protein
LQRSPRLNIERPKLGALAPTGLIDARKQLHHALQLVASGARSFATPQPKDAHAQLSWMPEHDALVTEPLGASEESPRLALQLDTPSVAIVKSDGTWIRLPLTGRVRTEAAGWLRAQMAVLDLHAASYLLDCPYVIPHHPVTDGIRFFEPSDVALGTPEELAKWFMFADSKLRAVSAREEHASDVKCSPHHFSIATQIALPQSGTSGRPSSMAVGMSPGDASFEMPYFYVTPSPTPDPNTPRPDLLRGRWRSDGWSGAVLTVDKLLAPGNATPEEQLNDFLGSAIEAVRTCHEKTRS